MNHAAGDTHNKALWPDYLNLIWIAVLLAVSVATTAYDFVRLGYPWKWFFKPWSDFSLLLCFFSDAILTSGVWMFINSVKRIKTQRAIVVCCQDPKAISETVWPPSPRKP